MRIVFYGLNAYTLETAKKFIEEEHDVIIIDPNRDKIDEVSDNTDCSFLVGDASHPNVFQEVNPKETKLFFALSDNSQNNIVSCLIAKSMGVERTILRIDDPDYEEVCGELDLREVIIPAQVTAQYFLDAVLNENLLELFRIMKEKAGMLKILIKEEHEGKKENLNLPSGTRVVCYFREGKFHHYEADESFKAGDEVVLLTEKEQLQELIEEWNHRD